MIGHLKHDATCATCDRVLKAGTIVVGRNVPLTQNASGWECLCGRCGNLITFGPFPVVEGRAS